MAIIMVIGTKNTALSILRAVFLLARAMQARVYYKY